MTSQVKCMVCVLKVIQASAVGVLGHFGHGHFGHGRFGQDISATDISATGISATGHFGHENKITFFLLLQVKFNLSLPFKISLLISS